MNIIVVLLSTLIIINCSQLYPKPGNNYDGAIYDYDVEKTNQDENVNDEPFIPAGFQNGQPNQIDSYGRCIEWNEETKQEQLCTEGKPRVVKVKIFLDDIMIAKYKEKFGEKYKEEATNIIKKVINSASKYLKELDHGGYITKMDEPLLLLSKSPYKIGNTYIDRRRNNLKYDLEKSDIIGYAFAFQEAVDNVENHQQSTDTILYVITPRGNSVPQAATEELCLCKNPPPFPCVGIFSVEMEPDYEKSGMLLAHEIGHALGAKEHDSEIGTIMYGNAWRGGVWSQFSKDQINEQNNSCLKETESFEKYFESGIMKTDAKNPPQDD